MSVLGDLFEFDYRVIRLVWIVTHINLLPFLSQKIREQYWSGTTIHQSTDNADRCSSFRRFEEERFQAI